jgi:hypothetical protein
MKKRLLLALLAVAATSLALGAGQAAATPDGNHSAAGVTDPALSALITNDDLFSVMDLTAPLATAGSNRTQHYGPYPSDSPDSGTCGNDWAEDKFDRHFTVRPNADGTFTVVQQFKRGSFETNAGPSPGSCQMTDGSPPGTVNSGITGSMHGYFVITVTGTQTSTDPSCVVAPTTGPCTTTSFIESHFTGSVFTIGTFFFHYSAGDQGLVEHEWKNASDDRGGNHGDIRSTNVP